MKRKIIIAIIFLVCLNTILNAQINQGTTLIGGRINFNRTQNDTFSTTNSGSVQLKIGRAFSENIVWGIYGGYTWFKQKAGVVDQHGSGFSIGAFNRLYKPLGNEFYFFGESALGYSNASSNAIDNAPKTINSSFGLGLTPGLSYKILDWAHLEVLLPDIFSISYTQNKLKRNNISTVTEENFSAKTSLSNNPLNMLGVGFSLLF